MERGSDICNLEIDSRRWASLLKGREDRWEVQEMTREYTLETVALVTRTRLSELKELVKEGYLKARPHRTYVVTVEDDEDLATVVLGAQARKSSPSDVLKL